MTKPQSSQTIKNGPEYRGRFAPSPSGPLHFGSLIAAVASYLEAITNQGEWLLRIEDIDPPREITGAADLIIEALDCHGFEWTGPVLYQSLQIEAYEALSDSLLEQGIAYRCQCSREDIRALNPHMSATGPVYPGTCRPLNLQRDDSTAMAIRLKMTDMNIRFMDLLQGETDCQLSRDIGDIVLRRKDGLIGYSLAVVADDERQGITDIVRGCDLLPLTPAHIFLQQQLNFNVPSYMHIPLAMHPDGQKLSKQSGADAINIKTPSENLIRSLQFLGQNPPNEIINAPVADIWQWARNHWHPDNLATKHQLPE